MIMARATTNPEDTTLRKKRKGETSLRQNVQVKSAAAIAALELRPGDDEKKNKILKPVPHPNYNRLSIPCIRKSMTWYFLSEETILACHWRYYL